MKSRASESIAMRVKTVLPVLPLLCGVAWAGGVDNPRRIAESPTPGQLLVTDRRHDAIIAVDASTLEPLWSFDIPLDGAPFGLATWKRRVYVGNTENRNVEVYRLTGAYEREDRRLEDDGAGEPFVPRTTVTQQEPLRFLFNLGHVPAGQTGFLDNPTDIAVEPVSGRVFVLDASEKKVEIFDHRGSLVGGFFPVDGSGRLLSPVSLTVDPARREVIVGDYGDPSGSFRAQVPARILGYSYDGALTFQIDGNGDTDPGTIFARVQGLAVGNGGRIFAADPLGGRVLVLDRDTGATLAEVGNPGDEPGQLMLPLDVLMDEASGDLFVSNNRGARRLEVFRGIGRTGVLPVVAHPGERPGGLAVDPGAAAPTRDRGAGPARERRDARRIER